MTQSISKTNIRRHTCDTIGGHTYLKYSATHFIGSSLRQVFMMSSDNDISI